MVFQSAATITEFVLFHCRLLHGKKFFSPKSKASPPLRKIESYAEFFHHYQLKGVREDSSLGLLGWLRGTYPVELRLDIPEPREVLDLQCGGRRIATLLLKAEDQFAKIGRHSGAYAFLLHDLEHAHKFFGGEFRGQMRFFNLLRIALDAQLFEPFRANARFQSELNYLMSDMNSHPVHLLKYLKAIVLAAGAVDLNQWCESLLDLWQLPNEAKTAAMRVNYPGVESRADLQEVSRFFGAAT